MKRGLQATAGDAQSALGDPDSPYLLTEEAATFLRFSTPHLFYKWARRNRVPVLRRGRTLLYRRSVLDAFLQQKPWTHARNLRGLHAVTKGEEG